MAPQLRPDEEWVRQCLQAALAPANVVQFDDGTANGMHDLDIVLDGERVGAVEISAAVDAAAQETWSLAGRSGTWATGGLTESWMVTITSTAVFRRLRSELEPLLDRLSARGIGELELDWLDYDDAEADLARSMGIVSLRQFTSRNPGCVYVSVQQADELTGGAVPDHCDGVADWISEWLRADHQRDNLAKLVRSGAHQRHMVTLLRSYTTAPFDVVWALIADDTPLPTIAPDLPDEVTHCWLLSSWADGRGFRWTPDGWSYFDKLQPSRA